MIATGQATGHDRREGRVIILIFNIITIIKKNKTNTILYENLAVVLAWYPGYSKGQMLLLQIAIGTKKTNLGVDMSKQLC
jgi:hypothetical protein